MAEETANPNAHPECINASNPYHKCVDYCFRKIAEKKALLKSGNGDSTPQEGTSLSELPSSFGRQLSQQPLKRRRDETEDKEGTHALKEESLEEFLSKASGTNPDGIRTPEEEPELPPDFENMSERQRKMFELRLKLNQARKANQSAVVVEKKKEQEPVKESRGISKAMWLEEKQKKMGKVLEANGLDMKKAYMLDSVEEAEAKYKKWEKKPAPFGWDAFNEKSLYNAYKKRAKKVPYTMEEYNLAKASDPEFYRDGSSLQYGKVPDIPKENVNRMVLELEERAKSRKDYSRRRRFHDEKDIDSINDRNEHFNRKIERAFGKYTIEIKNNLERGTALPD